jgi:hypothetical protein
LNSDIAVHMILSHAYSIEPIRLARLSHALDDLP